MGIIDTLSVGFDRVTKRLWLILIPVAVDIGIWIGPKLSVSKLSRQALAVLPNGSELGAQYQESLELLREWLTGVGAGVNLLSLLSMRMLGLSSLTASFAPQARLLATERRVIEVQSWAALLGLIFILVALSLLAGCLCFSWLAQDAREEEMDVAYVLQVTARSWMRLVALVVLGSIAAAALLIGTSFGYGLLTVISPQLGALLFGAMAIGFMWVSVYAGMVFFFTPRAMILDNMGILRSLWNSVNVIHRNFLSTVIFVVLVNVLQTGLMYIWRLLATSAVGTLAGILGNAYVSTGLAMASFVFYLDRFVAWQDARP